MLQLLLHTQNWLAVGPCMLLQHSAVVGTNLCGRRPSELKGKGIKGMIGLADKEAHTVLL